MNKKIGTILGAGLIWLGLQTGLQAQNITIRIGGSERGGYWGGGFPTHWGNSLGGGVVYKPGNRSYGGVIYRGVPHRPFYRKNTVIYSGDNECRDRYRQSYRSRDYRSNHPARYYRQRDVYSYPDDYSLQEVYYRIVYFFRLLTILG
ncbi:MAG: hypothetical protein HC784_11115 [Hydrococcus sp. CSU_1_8]|nr:hypothetical protein [Hydrococcus sp. CSU_1_8]